MSCIHECRAGDRRTISRAADGRAAIGLPVPGGGCPRQITPSPGAVTYSLTSTDCESWTDELACARNESGFAPTNVPDRAKMRLTFLGSLISRVLCAAACIASPVGRTVVDRLSRHAAFVRLRYGQRKCYRIYTLI